MRSLCNDDMASGENSHCFSTIYQCKKWCSNCICIHTYQLAMVQCSILSIDGEEGSIDWEKKKKKNEMICISRMTLFNKCHHRISVYCLCHTASREKTVLSIRNTLYFFASWTSRKNVMVFRDYFFQRKEGPLVPWNILGFVCSIAILFWPRTIFLFKLSSHCLLGHKS